MKKKLRYTFKNAEKIADLVIDGRHYALSMVPPEDINVHYILDFCRNTIWVKEGVSTTTLRDAVQKMRSYRKPSATTPTFHRKSRRLTKPFQIGSIVLGPLKYPIRICGYIRSEGKLVQAFINHNVPGIDLAQSMNYDVGEALARCVKSVWEHASNQDDEMMAPAAHAEPRARDAQQEGGAL